MGIPVNIIINWFGAINDIPNGWLLCDGTNGTPDLRNRFVVGAGELFNLNEIGGTNDSILPEHIHSGATNSFSHSHIAGGTSGGGSALTIIDGFTSFNRGSNANGGHTHNPNGLTSSTIGEASGIGKNVPPYFALAYIMYGGN